MKSLIVGSTGISGQSVVRALLERGDEVIGLSRGGDPNPRVQSIRADLRDAAAIADALHGIDPEVVVITAWMRQDTEAENIRVNGGLVRDLLAALEPAGSVRHVALVTGLKHYLGPFEAYGTSVMAETPFHESEPRLDYPNFYYAQEDELFAAAERMGFTWSVHRSHSIFGFATGNAMNMALTLSVYASLCKANGEPFVFPGSSEQWNGLTDVTDADLLADQMVWAATHPAGRNEAFNITNGDVFRWRWLWPQIAEFFGVEWEGYSDSPRPLEGRMASAGEDWRRLADEHDLVEPDVERLASWWHTDGDLGRNLECLTDMTKSREAGFLGFRSTPRSFFDKVERYRTARIIP